MGDQGAPGSVSFESIFPSIDGRKIRLSDGLAGVYKLAYQLPTFAGEQYAFWAIDDRSAKQLGRATEACLANMPTHQKKAVDKFVSKVMPLVSLVAVAFVITYPRVKLTMEMSAYAKPSQPVRPTVAPVSTPQNGARQSGPEQRTSSGIDWSSTGLSNAS